MPLTNEAEMPVAIVGAGFSGTLLAINLVRQGARVVLIERDGGASGQGAGFRRVRLNICSMSVLRT
jgi:2-polyprenyl-6-methoxyphenol hydroxylase-like FAD-dependent oxidoreductase